MRTIYCIEHLTLHIVKLLDYFKAADRVPQLQLKTKLKIQADIVALLLVINKSFLSNNILIPSFFR